MGSVRKRGLAACRSGMPNGCLDHSAISRSLNLTTASAWMFHQRVGWGESIEAGAARTARQPDRHVPRQRLDQGRSNRSPRRRLVSHRANRASANPKDGSKLNLSNEQGAFIGQVLNAWFSGRQLRADIDLSKPAPIDDWTHIRATLFSCIARYPESLGCSLSYEPSPLRPIGVDLVCRPRFNRNGILGHPRPRIELLGSPGTSPMAAYHERLVWNWLARLPEPHAGAGNAERMGTGSPT